MILNFLGLQQFLFNKNFNNQKINEGKKILDQCKYFLYYFELFQKNKDRKYKESKYLRQSYYSGNLRGYNTKVK